MALGLKDVASFAAAALTDYGRLRVDETALVTRGLTVGICAVLAVGFGLAALVCGTVALWIYMVPYTGAVAATLIVAAIWLVACLVMAFVTVRLLQPKPRPVVTPKLPPADQLVAQGMKLVKEHKGPMLLAALVAGMMAADAD